MSMMREEVRENRRCSTITLIEFVFYGQGMRNKAELGRLSLFLQVLLVFSVRCQGCIVVKAASWDCDHLYTVCLASYCILQFHWQDYAHAESSKVIDECQSYFFCA